MSRKTTKESVHAVMGEELSWENYHNMILLHFYRFITYFLISCNHWHYCVHLIFLIIDYILLHFLYFPREETFSVSRNLLIFFCYLSVQHIDSYTKWISMFLSCYHNHCHLKTYFIIIKGLRLLRITSLQCS